MWWFQTESKTVGGIMVDKKIHLLYIILIEPEIYYLFI